MEEPSCQNDDIIPVKSVRYHKKIFIIYLSKDPEASPSFFTVEMF